MVYPLYTGLALFCGATQGHSIVSVPHLHLHVVFKQTTLNYSLCIENHANARMQRVKQTSQVFHEMWVLFKCLKLIPQPWHT